MKRLLLALVLLTGCATTSPQFIDEADQAIWGIHVEDDAGRVLHSRNSNTLMIPASNRKLFTAATIAECLGTNTQLTTEIFRDGDDLVIRGDGDPSLGSPRYAREHDFDPIANGLLGCGVTRVRDIIADVSRFDRVLIPGGWKVGNLKSDYSAPVDAIAWQENEIENVAVPDPALFAAAALRDSLVARGIEVTGTLRIQTEPHAWRELIGAIESPFVGQLLMTVLKNSHNLYAEMLFKRTMGGTYDFATEQHELAEFGTFRFVDGSGLAPDNLVTPTATVKLLRWMNHPARRAFWWTVLAQPANEGTLRSRLVSLEHRMRGKTGTINGVNALSGIIAMPGGGFRYFAVVVNHHLSDEANKTIDAIVEQIADPRMSVPRR